MTETDNGSRPAFPQGDPLSESDAGMSKREYFAAMALANPAICTGAAHEFYLRRWFGQRTGIEAAEIRAMQAVEAADALLSALRKEG